MVPQLLRTSENPADAWFIISQSLILVFILGCAAVDYFI